MHVHVHAMETVSGAEAAFSLWESAGAVEAFRRESPLSTSNGPVPKTRSGVDGTNHRRAAASAPWRGGRRGHVRLHLGGPSQRLSPDPVPEGPVSGAGPESGAWPRAASGAPCRGEQTQLKVLLSPAPFLGVQQDRLWDPGPGSGINVDSACEECLWDHVSWSRHFPGLDQL